MSKESALKKEFKKSDVERIRNIIKKDFTSGTKTQIGYERDNKKRKEGDVWEERGKAWTIKNGIKQNITKLDKAKEYTKIPLGCPKCNGPMHHPVDKKMYRIHGFCFDCTIEYEATLRRAGLYKKYEEQMIKGNIGTFLQDMEAWTESFYRDKNSYITEDGVVEDWTGSGKAQQDETVKQVKEFTSFIRSYLNQNIYSKDDVNELK